MKRIFTTLAQKWPEYILEILVLIIGIYGAFAVENWNENRKDNEKEKAIIQNIHEEFEQNVVLLKRIKKGHLVSYKSCLWLQKQYPILASTSDLDSISYHIEATLSNWTFEPVQGRIKWLIASDNFDLIRNKNLQEALLSWQMTYQDYEEDEQVAYNFNENILFPYFSKNFTFDLDLSDPRFDLNELSTLRFEGMIDNRTNYLKNILFNDTDELKRLEALINKIVVLTDQSNSKIN